MAEQRDFNSSTVWMAAGGDDINQLIEALTTHGHLIDTPDPHDWKRTPMHHAAMNGNVVAIETLVRFGSKAIDTPDNHGWTPLHAAAWNGHVNAIEALVRLGSKAIDSPDSEGWTPMIAAAQYGHGEVIEALVRLGSKAIDTTSCTYGWTPIHHAAINGNANVIETLVRLGSNAIDTPDNDGFYALLWAVDYNNVDSVKILKALNTNSTSPIKVREQDIELTVDEVVEMRYRVYFAHSLVDRLLFESDRLSNTRAL